MNTTPSSKLPLLQSSIIKTLIYFDVFSYPLTGVELFEYLQIKAQDEAALLVELKSLCEKQLVFNLNGYYSLRNQYEQVEKRLIGNKYAETFVPKAFKNAKLIGSFPFVRGVGISGSLSKGYMDESGDVDFFIITEPERLWIARTLLILYKKIFLLNSRKYFCVNYFIDTNHLEIPDKNIFTATEILTLIPAYNSSLFQSFLDVNNWAINYLPNKFFTQNKALSTEHHLIKNGIEKLLNNKLGEYLDAVFMRLTLKKWKSKFKYIESIDFELAMRTRKYVSKHHPQGFQQRVLSKIEEKINEFEFKNNLKLN